MKSRTLIVCLGQLRAHRLTWESFKHNVLDELKADLAVCVPNDSFFNITNPYYRHAKFRWLVPDAPDLATIFDDIQCVIGSVEDWRVVCDIKGNWIGRISQANQHGAAAVLFILRWFMLDNIRSSGLLEVYDRFVITRSDFYYLCPHPPLEYLDDGCLWIPEGEDYGGFCDRHLVVSAADLMASCDLIDDILIKPDETRLSMSHWSDWGIERFIKLHFKRNGLLPRVRRFPYVMYLVRDEDDPTAWSHGSLDARAGMVVKYQTEFQEAMRFRGFIRTREDWIDYFISHSIASYLPARVYTNFGTVVFIDENCFQLRHGSIDTSPKNLLFIPYADAGFFVYQLPTSEYRAIRYDDQGEPTGKIVVISEIDPEPVYFDRVAISQEMNTSAIDFVGLRHGDVFLSAEPDGRLPLNRTRLLNWEYFRVIPVIGEERDRYLATFPISLSVGTKRIVPRNVTTA